MLAPADHARNRARNRARALEIAELRRQGLLFKTIGARLGVSEQLAWQQMTRGCPHFWGDVPLKGRPPGGKGAPRLSNEPPRPPESLSDPWWKPDATTLALVRAIKAEMRRDSERVCFMPREHE